MSLFLRICFVAIVSSTTLMAVEAPRIRGGHIVMSYKETARKIKWGKVDGTYNYLQPKAGKNFVNLVVKLKNGFSISTQDYSLKAQGLKFTAISVVELKKNEVCNYGVNKTSGITDAKEGFFKILFEVPRDIDIFDIIFNFKTTIKQETIKQQSFTFSSKEIFKISDEY